MVTATLPARRVLVKAFLKSDESYEGIFVTAVKTTGIFCRPTCPARKPKPENVEFFSSCGEALLAGYRPCKRCAPLAPPGRTPAWLAPLLDAVDRSPARRWRDADLRRLGLEPARVSRWFKAHHGMTFHTYSRTRRLTEALGRIRAGGDVTQAAGDVGYESLSGFNEAFQKFAGQAPTRLRDAQIVHVTRIETPIGPMVAGATTEHVVLLEYIDRRLLPTQIARIAKSLGCLFAPGETALLATLRHQLEEYFGRERSSFDVPLLTPGTEFQMKVWDALRRIPPGATRSYLEVAKAIGRPTAVRAVARANGDNRIAIIIPCHRVIGSNGQLVGYGGGLWRKQRLLELELGAAAQLPL